MSPLAPNDAVAAVERAAAWRWADVPVAFAGAAGEPWMLALVALALYAWLEQAVTDVLDTFFPLLVAVAASAGLAVAARTLGGGGSGAIAGEATAPVLRALSGGQAAGVSVLAVYSLLAYGRRARAALAFAVVFAVGRVLSGPDWPLELGAGALLGGAVAASVYGSAVRVFPAGSLARARGARRLNRLGARADRPSP